MEGRGCVRGQLSLPRRSGKLGVQLGSVVGRWGLTSQLCSAQARQAGQAQRWWPVSMESPDHQGNLRWWGRPRSGWEGKPQIQVRTRSNHYQAELWWTRQGGQARKAVHGSGSGLMKFMARHGLDWAGDLYSSDVAQTGTEGSAEMWLLSQWRGTWWRAEVSLFGAVKSLFSTLRMLLDYKLIKLFQNCYPYLQFS